MFPVTYFAPRFFPGNYWAEIGQTAAPSVEVLEFSAQSIPDLTFAATAQGVIEETGIYQPALDFTATLEELD
jgi:hypothetical protein